MILDIGLPELLYDINGEAIGDNESLTVKIKESIKNIIEADKQKRQRALKNKNIEIKFERFEVDESKLTDYKEENFPHFYHYYYKNFENNYYAPSELHKSKGDFRNLMNLILDRNKKQHQSYIFEHESTKVKNLPLFIDFILGFMSDKTDKYEGFSSDVYVDLLEICVLQRDIESTRRLYSHKKVDFESLDKWTVYQKTPMLTFMMQVITGDSRDYEILMKLKDKSDNDIIRFFLDNGYGPNQATYQKDQLRKRIRLFDYAIGISEFIYVEDKNTTRNNLLSTRFSNGLDLMKNYFHKNLQSQFDLDYVHEDIEFLKDLLKSHKKHVKASGNELEIRKNGRIIEGNVTTRNICIHQGKVDYRKDSCRCYTFEQLKDNSDVAKKVLDNFLNGFVEINDMPKDISKLVEYNKRKELDKEISSLEKKLRDLKAQR